MPHARPLAPSSLALVSLAILVVAAALAACGEDGGSEPIGEPSPESPDGEGPDDGNDDEDPVPTWQPPQVLGSALLEDTNPDPHIVEVTLVAELATVPLAPDFSLEMWTYNGNFPGPLLQATVGDEVIVHFTNQLPEPTTIHWHGLRIPDAMDGNPRIQSPVEPGETFTYRFTVPDAGTFWYHPHVRSQVQVERGLYGPIVIHDPEDPAFDAERVVVLDDLLVDGDTLASFQLDHMTQMHGRLGNVLLANGWAASQVLPGSQGHVERWRLANAANARTLEVSVDGARWRVVGTDGGRLPEAYETERLVIAVGQRYDLEVSFDDPGDVSLDVHVPVVDESGNVVEEAFEVFAVDAAETGSAAPSVAWPARGPLVDPSRVAGRLETIVLDAYNGSAGIVWTINGEARAEEPLFTFTEGEAVRLRIVNNLGPEHPFHLHGQFFEIVDDGSAATRGQVGLKDTVLVPGLETVEVIAYFDNPGRWMVHCHILEHAALGMMAEVQVEARQ